MDISTLGLALDPQNRTVSADNPEGQNVGGLVFNKEEGSAYGEMCARLLQRYGGTFVWDMRDPVNGLDSFDNIHQYAAAEMFAPNGKFRARIEASQEYESAARSGFNTFTKWAIEKHGYTVYRLKEPGSGNKITAITIDADYVPPYTDKPASELMMERDIKQIKGQVVSAKRRLASQYGDEGMDILQDAIHSGLATEIPAPLVKRLEMSEGNAE